MEENSNHPQLSARRKTCEHLSCRVSWTASSDDLLYSVCLMITGTAGSCQSPLSPGLFYTSLLSLLLYVTAPMKEYPIYSVSAGRSCSSDRKHTWLLVVVPSPEAGCPLSYAAKVAKQLSVNWLPVKLPITGFNCMRRPCLLYLSFLRHSEQPWWAVTVMRSRFQV